MSDLALPRSSVDMAWWVIQAYNDRRTVNFACTAGLGSGKTHGAVQWHHLLCHENYKADISAFSEPTYQKIHDSAIPKFRKVLKQFGLHEGLHYKIYKSPYPILRYLCFPKTKHEIHFISADNPDAVVAVEYSHATSDEAGSSSRQFTDNLISRIRDKNSVRRQILQIGAPQGLTSFSDDFDSDMQEGWRKPHPRSHWIQKDIEGVIVQKRRFKVWSDDNVHNLPPGYIQAFIQAPFGHNANLIKSYRYGEFCALTEGACYTNYIPQKHDIENMEPDPYREIILWMDFNVAPLAWTAGQIVPFDSLYGREFKAVAMHEAETTDKNGQLDDAAVEFASKMPPYKYGKTRILIYGDRTGHFGSHKISGSDFENYQKYLEELGYENVEIRATRLVAPEASSVDSLNKLFSKNLFLLCRRCNNLRKSLTATAWKKGIRKIDKPNGETWTHPADGVKYWAWQEMRDFDGKSIRRIHGTNG